MRVKSVTIEYRNVRNSSTWTKIQVHQYINEYVVTNLKEATKYEFKLLVTNAIGDSGYTKILQVFTESTVGR